MTNANPLITDETTLLGGRVKLLQPRAGLRAGLDAVILAASVPVKAGGRVLDLGCGTGGAGLCVLARTPTAHLTGLDIQAELLDITRRSAALNGWQNNTHFIAGDVRNKTLLPPDSFDCALSNPPYMEAGSWYDSPDTIRSKSLGTKADDATLKDWIDCLHRVVKPSGSVSIIHRADYADKLIQALGARFGGLELWPLHPRAGEPAKRIIIRALKNRKSPLTLHAGITLHTENGDWTPQAAAILAQANPL